MAALDELSDFIVKFTDAHAETVGASGRRDVDMILNAPVPSPSARQAVLYGFADEIGATAADGFDPAWKPTP